MHMEVGVEDRLLEGDTMEEEDRLEEPGNKEVEGDKDGELGNLHIHHMEVWEED